MIQKETPNTDSQQSGAQNPLIYSQFSEEKFAKKFEIFYKWARNRSKSGLVDVKIGKLDSAPGLKGKTGFSAKSSDENAESLVNEKLAELGISKMCPKVFIQVLGEEKDGVLTSNGLETVYHGLCKRWPALETWVNNRGNSITIYQQKNYRFGDPYIDSHVTDGKFSVEYIKAPSDTTIILQESPVDLGIVYERWEICQNASYLYLEYSNYSGNDYKELAVSNNWENLADFIENKLT